MLDFLVWLFLLRYKAIGILKNFGERCQIRDLQQINNLNRSRDDLQCATFRFAY